MGGCLGGTGSESYCSLNKEPGDNKYIGRLFSFISEKISWNKHSNSLDEHLDQNVVKGYNYYLTKYNFFYKKKIVGRKDLNKWKDREFFFEGIDELFEVENNPLLIEVWNISYLYKSNLNDVLNLDVDGLRILSLYLGEKSRSNENLLTYLGGRLCINARERAEKEKFFLDLLEHVEREKLYHTNEGERGLKEGIFHKNSQGKNFLYYASLLGSEPLVRKLTEICEFERKRIGLLRQNKMGEGIDSFFYVPREFDKDFDRRRTIPIFCSAEAVIDRGVMLHLLEICGLWREDLIFEDSGEVEAEAKDLLYILLAIKSEAGEGVLEYMEDQREKGARFDLKKVGVHVNGGQIEEESVIELVRRQGREKVAQRLLKVFDLDEHGAIKINGQNQISDYNENNGDGSILSSSPESGASKEETSREWTPTKSLFQDEESESQ